LRQACCHLLKPFFFLIIKFFRAYILLRLINFFHAVKFFSILFTDWEGPPPLKGCQVFIGLIASEVFEDELYHLFSTIGPIYELRLMMDFSGSNRGFAFVQYTNQLDVTDVGVAIRKLNKYEIRTNYRIGVLKSIDNCRLFIGGIPKDKSKEEINAEMEKLTEGIAEIIVYKFVFVNLM